jgi:hypothetical protein
MSSKTAAEKMYIKPGMQIGFFNGPNNLLELLGGLPDEVDIKEDLETAELDFVLGFIEDRRMLEKKLVSLKNAIKDDGALWLAYHKGTSSVDTDINRDSIHRFAKNLDLKGVSMVSIDDNWTGFRFKKK